MDGGDGVAKSYRNLIGVFAGLALLGFGGYVILGEHLSGVSVNAAVNARLTVLRSPIDGKLDLTVHTIGARVGASETVGHVADIRVDDGRLSELKRNEATLKADLVRIENQHGQLAKARADSIVSAQEYKTGRVNQLVSRLAEASAQTDAAEARLREANGNLDRARALVERGAQTAANLDRAQAARDVAAEELKVTKQRTAYLTVEMEAAKNGTFIGDSYNDAPYSMQRVRELELRLTEKDSELEHTRSRLQQLQKQIEDEQMALNRRTAAEIKAPAAGLIWDYLANDGEIVRKGQDLLRLVDCSSVIISASVGESLYNSLKPGDPAQFRLLGEGHVYPATIIRLAGSGASGRYGNFAVGPSPEHLTRYDVTLVSPSMMLDPSSKCSVGRTGRVVFSPGLAEVIQRYWKQTGL